MDFIVSQDYRNFIGPWFSFPEVNTDKVDFIVRDGVNVFYPGRSVCNVCLAVHLNPFKLILHSPIRATLFVLMGLSGIFPVVHLLMLLPVLPARISDSL